ncbi:hypothetical protein [Flavobacterium longum]|uniref:hypothetical protein n=1 Tax=Flavobacterium longum TaxID=1299340 RepID=UPI0039E9E417
MGFFSNKTKMLIEQFKKKNEYYSNGLKKDIDEQLDELRSEYEANESVVPEFNDFVASIKSQLGDAESTKLEEFAARFAKVSQTARNGVDAMWELSHNQRKLISESHMDYEEFEYLYK